MTMKIGFIEIVNINLSCELQIEIKLCDSIQIYSPWATILFPGGKEGNKFVFPYP